MSDIFTVLNLPGIVGLILVIIGVLVKDYKRKNIFFLLGGLFLFVYSFVKSDVIFMILQAVFAGAAAYNLLNKK